MTLEDYFTAQSQRPNDLRDVDLPALTPWQRALLTQDGTVTRLLEASAQEPLAVDLLDQRTDAVDVHSAAWLDVAPDDMVVRRRVAMTGRRSGHVLALAESLLVSLRLPAEFMTALSTSPGGLGETFAQLRLEARRDLLWYGRATTPEWAAAFDADAVFLTRSYRIIVAGAPAVLITESFPLR